jgi:hypothetical protein
MWWPAAEARVDAMSERKTPAGHRRRADQAFIASALTPLFILAALAAGVVALISLPREEEPQISVPMVDIHVQAQGLKAEDAVKLVTEPLEVIVKGINDVEHVYSSDPRRCGDGDGAVRGRHAGRGCDPARA